MFWQWLLLLIGNSRGTRKQKYLLIIMLKYLLPDAQKLKTSFYIPYFYFNCFIA